MKQFLRIVAATFGAACLILATPVVAHPVGWGTGGTPLATTHLFDPSLPGWTIADPNGLPIGITAVPDNAPWIKQLLIPPNLTNVPPIIPFSTVFTVRELIVVGQPGFPGPAWTDWHEQLIEGPWDWVGGTILSALGAPLPGLEVSLGDPGLDPDLGHSPEIWFDFDPIQPGTMIEIVKQIHCHGANGCPSTLPIIIREYPTIRVPEPMTPALVGVGLLVAAGLRRRGCA